MVKRAGPSAKYQARAQQLAEAITIGIEVRKAAGRTRAIPGFTKFELDLRRRALAPEPVFATLSSLKQLESCYFTFWNESPDRYVSAFWREIAKRKLPFARKDWARKALERGRITSALEHEQITDAIGDDRFTKAETAKLSKMLGAYEARRSK